MKKFAFILVSVSFLFPLLASADTTDTSVAATTPDTTATTPDTTAPSGAAYQFQRQGIFDCNQNGSYAMSVGALSAMGGAYVPVSDAAVELNTGTLVYKECVLREVVDRERESALSALFKQATVDVQTGRNGNPMYVVNEGNELVTGVADPTMLATLQDSSLWQNVPSDQVSAQQRALAQYYEGERTGDQATSLNCPYQGEQAIQNGQPLNSSTFFTDLFNVFAPQCDPIIENFLIQDIANARIAWATQIQMDQWNQGGGFYARKDANGNILTPSSVVEQSYEQLLQSPVQQLQNANDIGQMIGALYAGVTTQVIGDNQGLTGLTQSVGGQPSYLDQVAAESASGLQGAASNAALQILGAAQQIESAYYQAANAIGASLLQSQQQLQSAEAQCWAAIIPKVCATPLTSNNTCSAQTTCTTDGEGNQSCPTGATLTVATSTAFSSAVIAAKITPFTSAAASNIQASQAALQLIANLIQGVTDTNSLDAQRIALQQLDTLVAQHQLHTQTDLQTITQEQSTVANTMGTLLQTTAQTWSGTGTDSNGNSLNVAWDGTTNPGNGWCNINNSATLASWTQTWTK